MAKGTIYQYRGSFYVRYSVRMTLSQKSGKLRPVQKTHRLCDKNDKFYSTKAAAVKRLSDEFMLTVIRWGNESARACPMFHCPGYKQIWSQHLKSHFGNITLQEYEPHTGTPFLQALRYARQSYAEAHQVELG